MGSFCKPDRIAVSSWSVGVLDWIPEKRSTSKICRLLCDLIQDDSEVPTGACVIVSYTWVLQSIARVMGAFLWSESFLLPFEVDKNGFISGYQHSSCIPALLSQP